MALYKRVAKAIIKVLGENPYNAPYQWAAAVVEVHRSEGGTDPNETLSDDDVRRLLQGPSDDQP